jgi:hypothetical protein
VPVRQENFGLASTSTDIMSKYGRPSDEVMGRCHSPGARDRGANTVAWRIRARSGGTNR